MTHPYNQPGVEGQVARNAASEAEFKKPRYAAQFGQVYPTPGTYALSMPEGDTPALFAMIDGHWKIDLRGHVVISESEYDALKAGKEVMPDDKSDTNARPAKDPGVTTRAVRALEWHQTSESPIRYLGHPADVNGSDYVIQLVADNPDVWAWGVNGEGWAGRSGYIEHAQAAAQADYERRILSALAPTARVVTAEQLREWADCWETLIEVAKDARIETDHEQYIAAMRQIAEGKE